MRATLRFLACLVVGFVVGETIKGCGGAHPLGPLVRPAALTALAVADCMDACGASDDLVTALHKAPACTPVVRAASVAWCSAGIVSGPICEALAEPAP
jgi:hypothetical protein